MDDPWVSGRKQLQKELTSEPHVQMGRCGKHRGYTCFTRAFTHFLAPSTQRMEK